MKISLKDIQKAQKPKEEEWVFGYYVTRRISKYFTFLILRLFPRINPTIITCTASVFGISGAILLSFPNNLFWVIGSFLCFSFFIWDCVDGEIARIQRRASEFGKYLDRFFHPVFNSTVLGFSGLGLYFYTQWRFLLYLALFSMAFLSLSEVLEEVVEKKSRFDWVDKGILIRIVKGLASFQGAIFLLFLASLADACLNIFYFRLVLVSGIYIFMVLKTISKEYSFLRSLRK